MHRWAIERLEGRVVPSSITVMNTDDSGAGSLRAAIEQANVDAAQDTIAFAVTGTISVASPLPDLSAGMSIVGPGPSALTVARLAGGYANLPAVFTEVGRRPVGDLGRDYHRRTCTWIGEAYSTGGGSKITGRFRSPTT